MSAPRSAPAPSPRAACPWTEDTSITVVRERTTGTLERLMTMPLAKLDLLLGYGIGFAAVATLRALITAAVGSERSASTSPAPPCW